LYDFLTISISVGKMRNKIGKQEKGHDFSWFSSRKQPTECYHHPCHLVFFNFYSSQATASIDALGLKLWSGC
jgi:hypothetical protein